MPKAPMKSLETVALSSLSPDPENPRSHDQRNLDSIKASLEAHGQVEPLVVQASTGMVIAGNGRMEAMLSMGWEEAQVVKLDVSDADARRLSIRLNRSAELAGWNEDVLSKQLQELEQLVGEGEFDIEGLGFFEDEMEALVAAYGSLDDLGNVTPPDPDPPKTPKKGGDGTPLKSTGSNQVVLQMDSESVKQFHDTVRKLAAHYSLDNQSDTVFNTVLKHAESLGL